MILSIASISAACTVSTKETATSGESTGSTGESASSTGFETGSTGEMTECVGFGEEGDPGPIPPVDIFIRNDGAEPIYIGQEIPYDLLYVDNADELIDTVLNDGCGFTCQEIIDDGCCAPGDVPAVGIYIAPGGHYKRRWSGFRWDAKSMPVACLSEDADTTYCDADAVACKRQVSASDGAYRLEVNAHAECEGELCECVPNEEGWCELDFGYEDIPLGGAAIYGEALFNYSADDSVEVILP